MENTKKLTVRLGESCSQAIVRGLRWSRGSRLAVRGWVVLAVIYLGSTEDAWGTEATVLAHAHTAASVSWDILWCSSQISLVNEGCHASRSRHSHSYGTSCVGLSIWLWLDP